MLAGRKLNELELERVAGGSFWDDIGDFFEDAVDPIMDVAEEAAEVATELWTYAGK